MTDVNESVSEYLAKIGRKGGKARLKKMTDKQRSDVAALGGQARAKPTKCEKCGTLLPSAREAWKHCLKGGPGYDAWQAKKVVAAKKKK